MTLIRDAIKKADNSDETEKIIKEQLETLAHLANAQNDIDSQAIQMSLKDGKVSDDLKIPITKVMGEYRETHVVTTEGPSDVVNKLSSRISHFFDPGSQNILMSVAKSLNTSLGVLMGKGEGAEGKKSQVIVVVEYPSIIRFDFAMWVRNTRAPGLMKYCKNVVSVEAYKSAVDINKLDFYTFLALYGPILNDAFGSDQTKIKEKIEEAKEIYKRFSYRSEQDPDSIDQIPSLDDVEVFTEDQLEYHEEVYESSILEF